MQGVYKMSDELKQQAKEYKNSLFDANPEVKKFVKIRNALLLTLVGMILNIILMIQGIESTYYVVSNFVKLFTYIILLAIPAMSKWQGSLLLYFLAVPNVIAITSSLDTIASIGELFLYSPLLSALLLLEILFTILIILSAVWLTVFPKNRVLADNAKEITTRYQRFINDNIFK